MSNNIGIKKQILKELEKNKVGLTNFELSEKLGLTRQQVQDSLRESSATNYVTKGENLGAEGINYTISNAGLAYLKRKGEKSPLEQIEKTPVEAVEAAPIVEKSPLEQIENRDFEMPKSATDKITVGFYDTVEFLDDEPVAEESLTTESEEFIALPLTTNKHGISAESFRVWQIIDEAGAKMVELLQKEKAKPIDNIDYKIATLESLADIYNTKISTTLREIAADLKG